MEEQLIQFYEGQSVFLDFEEREDPLIVVIAIEPVRYFCRLMNPWQIGLYLTG
jgi:hypothetical protein